MTAVKSFAIGALVIGAVAHSTLAGPMRPQDFRWTGWHARGGLAYVPPAPFVAPAPVPPVANPVPAPAPIIVAPPAPQPIVYTAPTSVPTWQNTAVAGSTAPVFAPVIAAPTVVATSTAPGTPTFNPSSVLTSAAPPASTSASPAAYDAFVNLTGNGFNEAGTLTAGNPQAWYNSPIVSQVFGGQPNAQQRADFTAKVLADVQHTFDLANVPVHLTTDPNASASHTLSVVSNASYGQDPNAIGITDVGRNGFDFIDKLTGAQTPDQLALAVGHNVAHELMHAFGVAVHHDQTGTYVDSGSASWSMLSDPNATFSPAAAQDLLSQNFSSGGLATVLGAQTGASSLNIDGAQILAAQTVPEPSTIALWLAAGGVVALVRRNRLASRSAA